MLMSYGSWKRCVQDIAWTCFAGLGVVTLLRTGGVVVSDRIDDHTIEKVVYEEKERIVYLPANDVDVDASDGK